MVDELEKLLQAAEDEKALAESQYQDAVNAKDKWDERGRDLLHKLKDLNAQLARANDELSKADERLKGLQDERKKALRDKNHALDEVGKVESNKAALLQDREKQLEEIKRIEEDAKQISPRLTVPEKENSISLEKKYNRYKRDRERGEDE